MATKIYAVKVLMTQGVMHRVLLLFMSSTVACTNRKINQITNMSATFITAIVHVLHSRNSRNIGISVNCEACKLVNKL